MAFCMFSGSTSTALGQGGGPVITSLSPALVAAGGSPFTLTINGNNFVASNVQWNGSPLTTTFVSATQLTALVPANLIASAGSASVTVVNAGGATSAPVIFTMGPAPTPLTVVPPSTLPSGSVGTYYSQSLYASGGTAPYSWSLLSGTLPPGLSISSTGVITGTPTAPGTAAFTANVMDAVGANALQIFSLPIGTTQSFTSAQRIPQIVDGGGWKTRFIITNTDQIPVTYTFQFWSQNGSTLALPILNGTAGVLSGTVAPGASVFAETPGTSPTLQVGWGEVASNGRIRVTAFYQYQVGGLGIHSEPWRLINLVTISSCHSRQRDGYRDRQYERHSVDSGYYAF
jgi:Putative Ig domain